MKKILKKLKKSFYTPMRVNNGVLVPSGKDRNTDVSFKDALKHMKPMKVW